VATSSVKKENIVYKSAERLKLEAALQEATAPGDIVAISAALHNLTNREDRRRARRRKKAEAKEKAWPPRINDDAPFEINY
jgi:hypothetical protein